MRARAPGTLLQRVGISSSSRSCAQSQAKHDSSKVQAGGNHIVASGPRGFGRESGALNHQSGRHHRPKVKLWLMIHGFTLCMHKRRVMVLCHLLTQACKGVSQSGTGPFMSLYYRREVHLPRRRAMLGSASRTSTTVVDSQPEVLNSSLVDSSVSSSYRGRRPAACRLRGGFRIVSGSGVPVVR